MKLLCAVLPAYAVWALPELLRISTTLNTLKKNGVTVERYNLSNSPQEFVNNKEINEFIRINGVDELPAIVVGIVISGRYPSNDEFVKLLDIPTEYLGEKPKAVKLSIKKAKSSGCGCSELSEKGEKVHLTTTDPAAHLKFVINESSGITLSHIDEHAELKKYQEEVLAKARETMSDEDIAYIEEDLRSPCTQEIAVFRAFAQIVEKAENEIVVIDTAPTGHTLLLLDSTQSYHREIQRSQGDIPESVKKLLPRLRNADETEVIIVTLAEATPVYEALRLEEDLKRANIAAKWWVINSSLYYTGTTNEMLAAKASNEIEWINKVDEHTAGKFTIIGWSPYEIKGEELKELFS